MLMTIRQPIVILNDQHTPLLAADKLPGSSIALSTSTDNIMSIDISDSSLKASIVTGLGLVGTGVNTTGALKVLVDPAVGNLLTAGTAGLHASAKVVHDVSLVGEGSTALPLRVQASTVKSNILLVDTTGVRVDGTHPAIPKFTVSTVSPVFSSPEKVFPNGAILIRHTATIKNPQGVGAIGGISQYSMLQAVLSQYFLNAAGNPIRTETTIGIISTLPDELTVTITVIFSELPITAFNVITDAPYPGTGVLNNFNIAVRGLVGYTPSQLGLV